MELRLRAGGAKMRTKGFYPLTAPRCLTLTGGTPRLG
jgi:hypothetical protein